MAKLIKNDGYIGIAKQAAKGTPEATSDYFIRYMEDGFTTEFETTPLREGGDGELIGTVVKNMHREKFSITALARAELVAYVFTYLLGLDTISGASDPFTHTITRGADRLWFTIKRKLPQLNKVQELVDCKIEAITIEAEAGKEVTLTIEGSGITANVLGAEETPIYEAMKPFVFYHSSGAFEVESIVNRNIKKFSIKYTIVSAEGLQTDEILVQDIPDLKIETDVALEFVSEDVSFWQKANYNNLTAPQEDLYYGAFEFDLVTTELVANDREFKFTIARFQFQPVAGMNLNGEPDVIVETIAGIGVKPTSGEFATVVAKNALAVSLSA